MAWCSQMEMKTKAVKWIERRRYGKPLAFVLGLLCCGLFLVTPLAAVAAPIYMDDFEDGDLSGWQETIVSVAGGSGIYPSGYSSGTVYFDNVNIDPVPIPSGVWLFGSGLIGLVGLTRRKKSA